MGKSYEDFIKGYDLKKLKFDEAQKLFKEMKKEKAEVKKASLREELVLGLQHKVIELSTSTNVEKMDASELISLINVYLVSIIDSGKFSEFKSFRGMFGKAFAEYLNEELTKKEDFVLKEDDKLEILVRLAKLSEEKEVTREDFFEVAKDIIDENQKDSEQANIECTIMLDALKLLVGEEPTNIAALLADDEEEKEEISELDNLNAEELAVIKLFSENSDKQIKKIAEEQGKSYKVLLTIYLSALKKLKKEETIEEEKEEVRKR